MKNADRILAILTYAQGPLCDDCLAARADVSWRQTVCQICAGFASSGTVFRARHACSDCGKLKKSSALRPVAALDG
jgi:hypothetical protein